MNKENTCVLQVVTITDKQGRQDWWKLLGEASSSNVEIIANIKDLAMSKRSLAQASSLLGSMPHWHKDFVTMATGHWTNEIISCHGNMSPISHSPGTCCKSPHPPTISGHLTAACCFSLVILLSLLSYVGILSLCLDVYTRLLISQQMKMTL